jgi:hypothetical protein
MTSQVLRINDHCPALHAIYNFAKLRIQISCTLFVTVYFLPNQ